MPDQQFKQEFHLTEDGWISGNTWLRRALEQPLIKRPIDAVQTWIRTENASLEATGPVIDTACVWSSQDFPPAAIAALHLRFPPGGLSWTEKIPATPLGTFSLG
ncbi:MAG: hypothetical protein EOP86_01425 [Verrucomicrobiaceae bacterium]|nr:MAG: hypothetical protein EOP86_01425 [Verrucomicrobiaceae bacterium]